MEPEDALNEAMSAIGTDIYDRDGRSITFTDWARLHADDRYRTVAITERGGVTVSTVWLGIDHQHGPGKPLIFETMVFGDDRDTAIYRYNTIAEADQGHAAMVEQVFGAQ